MSVARILACKEDIVSTGLWGRKRSPSHEASQEVRDGATQLLSEIEIGLSRLPEDMAPEAVRTVQELQQIVSELRIELCGSNQGT